MTKPVLVRLLHSCRECVIGGQRRMQQERFGMRANQRPLSFLCGVASQGSCGLSSGHTTHGHNRSLCCEQLADTDRQGKAAENSRGQSMLGQHRKFELL